MWRLAVFCCIVSAVRSQTTNVNSCTSHKGALPVNTYIEGCTNPPCVLPQLQDVVVHIVFEAPRNMNKMRTLATAYLQGPLGITIPVPYDLGQNSDTCNYLSNTYCPVKKGELVQYTLRMYIESFFPQGTSANIEFRVVDDFDTPVLCLRVPIRVAPPVISNSMSQN